MPFPRCHFRSVVYLFAVVALTFHAVARERGPRVEVTCPKPPSPVKFADKQILVYELHITNFDAVPLTLTRLEVFADKDKNNPIKLISGDVLSALVARPGSAGGASDVRTIAPGTRAIVFLWLEEGIDRRVPRIFDHRMVFTTSAPSGEHATASSEATIKDFPVPVSTAPVPVLRAPFGGGVWLAGDLANDSAHRRSLIAIDGNVHLPERFAIDWVKVGPNGDSHHDGTDKNENWWGYGEPIYAVADGEVTLVLDGIPENTPRVLPLPTLDNIAGNFVVIRIASNRFVTFAHLKNGSVKVHPGDRARRGDVIGLLGNSGNATGPHLHFQVTDGNSVLQSEGIPFVFDRFTDLGPGSDYEVDKHVSIPRELSIPSNNALVASKPPRNHV